MFSLITEYSSVKVSESADYYDLNFTLTIMVYISFHDFLLI